MMKAGDLVMWTGKDEHHGMMGIIVDIDTPEISLVNGTTFDVLWADGVLGFELREYEIMAVEDEERR